MKRFKFLIPLGFVAFATMLLAHTDDTTVGRLQLIHPDVGHESTGLHTKVRNAWTKISDNVGSRYEEYTSVADSTVTTVTHTFGAPFADYYVSLYDGTGTSKTLITDPTGDGWTIAANGSNPTTQIDVTAPSSGGPHDFSVLILHQNFLSTIMSGTAGAGFMELTHQSADPSATGANDIKLYAKSDELWMRTSSGQEQVSGGLTNPMDSDGDMIVGGASGVPAKLDHPGADNRVVRSTSTSATGFGQIDDPGFFTTGAAASASDIGIVTTAAQTLGGAKTFDDGITAVNTIGQKNYIINGAMTLRQRGTTPVSVDGTGKYGPIDRFKAYENTDGTATIGYSALVPTFDQAGYKPGYSTIFAVGSADSDGMGASQYAGISYRIEGYDYAELKGEDCYLSFWVYASDSGTYSLAFINNGADRSYVTTYSIASGEVSTWVKRSVQITFDYTGGTDNFTDGRGMRIEWPVAAGSNYQTGTLNQWIAGEYWTTNSSPVNLMSNSSGSFRLAMVQLTIGTKKIPFRMYGGGIQGETAAAQRYYEEGYSVATFGDNSGSRWAAGPINFNVLKRANPTVAVEAGSTGTANNVNIWYGGTTDYALSSIVSNDEQGFFIESTNTSLQSASVHFGWTAESEL